MQARCRLGAEEQPRCSQDAAMMQPRSSRGAAEEQLRYSLDAAEVQPKEFFTRKLAESGHAPHLRERVRTILETYDHTDNTVPVHGGILRLTGDLCIAWLCGEVCYEVKQEVAKVFEGIRLIFVGYGDGVAYIPDDRLIEEGGYEVDGSVVEFCLKGRFKPGITAKLVDAYREALERSRSESR